MWIRNHQNNIHAEVYQGLTDALHVGENIVGCYYIKIIIQHIFFVIIQKNQLHQLASTCPICYVKNVIQRTILPSLFIGNHRHLTKHYEDGVVIVLHDGRPNNFLAMTYNPSWSEISFELATHQTPQNCLDLLTRIFRAKFEQLKDNFINKGFLRKFKSYMHVTNFQK